jgi:cysteine-rich repeat protein
MRLICLALSLGIMAVAGPADAVTFTVDSTADAGDAVLNDGVCATAANECTLRAALDETNFRAGADEIVLPAGVYPVMAGNLFITDGLTLSGAGADVTIIDGGGTMRLLNISTLSADPVIVSGVTLRNGSAPGGFCGTVSFGAVGGGAICAFFNGMLTVRDSVVEACSTTQSGGAAIESIQLTLERTTIRSSSGAFPQYGAVHAIQLAVVDSTISDNPSGGIGVPARGHASIVNSTISGNGPTGLRVEGECFPSNCPAPGSAELENVTITGHTAEGIYNRRAYNPSRPPPDEPNAPTSIANTLLAGNGRECTGGLVSNGYNVVQNPILCDLTGDSTGNLIGATAALSPLADNGGPTATHALPASSIAINAGNPALCPATDQRGVARAVGGRCDIGAVESSCGDGVLDPGEDCDDGNGAGGDACPRTCASPRCGDGTVDAGEQCDDGNTVANDCCDACVVAAAGTTCTTDGNACTDDVCDAAGHCRWVDNVLPCDDGNPCTRGDVCSAGRCVSGQNCDGAGNPNFCTTCLRGVGCRALTEVVGTCMPPRAHGARMTFRDGPNDARDTASFQWRSSAPVTKDDFGIPSHAFGHWYCLTARGDDGAYTVLSLKDGCDAAGCWTETDKGFRYQSGAGQPGKLKVVLREGNPAEITIRSRGPRAAVPPLPLGIPAFTHFSASNRPGCWQAEFDTKVSRDTASRFRGTSE